ncbi:MAG: CpaF family protein [Acidimicrobiia bacterium]|nr:CpaF family protein [Acidimicrobiia bacterium]
MKLSERLGQVPEAPVTAPETGEGEDVAGAASIATPRPARDPLADFKRQARAALFSKLEARTIDASLDEPQLRRAVAAELERLMAAGDAPLSAPEREKIAEEITQDIVGHGPIEKYLRDTTVTEVMVNATDPIFIERDGRIVQTEASFASDEHLRHVIERIVARIGRRIDESSPMVDARLADGSRVNAVIPPLAIDGPALTIRKFSRDPYGIEELVGFGTLTVQVAGLLKACVQGRLNLLVSGGTGTGKTTLLNVLSSFIPSSERIVTIEDAAELQLRQANVVRLESRPPNIEGKGQVTIRDLLRNSLRMRPDRIVVGEVRGAEALDMLQAMNTGHDGSMSTLHANSPRDALNRLETMVLMAGMEIPIGAIRDYLSSAITVIVQLTRMRDGSRRITQVSEIVGMEGDIVTMQDVFRFRSDGTTDGGRMTGSLEPTGIRPAFAETLRSRGIALPAALFESGAAA